MLRVVIIGCGQVADLHLGEIRWIRSARVVAVCDSNPIMAEQAAERFEIPNQYTDAARMLREQRPDVVHITTPPQTHLELGRLAVEHGAHAYIEKPFTVTTAEAEELVACAQRAGRQLCAGHNYLFDAAFLDVRRRVADGALGELVHVDSVLGYNLDGPFGQVLLGKPNHWTHQLPGGLVQNVVSHALYPITEFVDDPEPEIHACACVRRADRFGDVRDRFHDELRVLLRGRRCSAHLLFTSHARPLPHRVRLYGTKGTVEVDFASRTVFEETVSSLPGALGRVALPFQRSAQELRLGLRNLGRFLRSDLPFNDGMRRLFKQFYAAIEEGRGAPVPMSEAVRVTRILERIIARIGPGGSPP